MSLRTIHIVFVVLCCTLALFLAVWSVGSIAGPSGWLWAAVSVCTGVAFSWYGIRFIRKTRGMA